MSTRLLIKGCRLLPSPTHAPVVDILVEDGTIAHVGAHEHRTPMDRVLEAGGRLAVPGFMDLHIQGAGGSDVLDGSSESLQTISRTLARFGVTGFLATTVVKPNEGNAHLKLTRDFMESDLGGARLLGIHLEGPFINGKKRGGIDPASIYPSSPAALEEILGVTGDSLKMMTIAPELPGNLEIIRTLTLRGVVASFGHSDASYDEAKRGFDAGISHVTHIFNAMPPLHHRTPGPLAAIVQEEGVTLQVISDGHHLHPGVVDLIYRLAGPRRCVCITDGISAMGLPDGRYVYNGREYESRDGAARYTDGTLIGSAMNLWGVALKFREFTGCPLEHAIDSISANAARALGIESRKGSFAPGKDADIVLLDDDLSVNATIVRGRICYRAQPASAV